MLLTPETVSEPAGAAAQEIVTADLTLLNQSKLPVTTANSSWPRNWWNRPFHAGDTPHMPMPPRKALQELAANHLAEAGRWAGLP